MPSKEKYCYSILKNYSLIVDFEGIPQHKAAPQPIDGETFGQWKKRVLGDDVENIVIYTPETPASQKRISTLQNSAGAEHFEKVFKYFNKTKTEQKKAAVESAVEKTELRFTNFSKETLEDLITELENDLEPSVLGFLSRYSEGNSSDVDTEALLRELLKACNEAVKRFRTSG